MCGEFGEVFRCRMRVDDAPARQACQADVRQRRERLAVLPHLLERCERCEQPGPVVRADRGDVEVGQARCRFSRGDSGERLGALVERQQRDDRETRDAADGLDRVDDLLEVVERLDHEHVDAAPVQNCSLLREELTADPRGGRFAERPDRAADEDVAPGDLPCVARELDARRVDLLEVVLEEVVGELAAVGAEGVRLDQVGARVDEAHVQRHDGIWSAEVRLLGTSQAGHCGGQQGAHPAVAHDRGPGFEPLLKTVPGLRLGGHYVSFRTRSTHPSGPLPGRVWHLAAKAGCRGFTGPVPSASLDAERTKPASGTQYRGRFFREVTQSTENG